MNDNTRDLTFAALDRQMGIPEPLPTSGDEFPLPAWYRAIRTVPLGQLGVEDLCKALRQQIHSDQIVPLALQILRSEPLAGGSYEGELLTAFNSLPLSYWANHREAVATLKTIVEQVLCEENLPDDLRKDAGELAAKVSLLDNRDNA